MDTQRIQNVAYRTDLKKPQNPDKAFDDRQREADIGEIILNDDNIEYRVHGKPTLVIKDIRNVVEGSSLGNKRIEIQYGTGLAPQVAYFFVTAANLWGRKYHEAFLAHAQSLTSSTSMDYSPERETQIKAIQQVAAYAAMLSHEKQELGNPLRSVGLDKKDIELLLLAQEEFERPAKAGQRNMLFGAMWFIGGSAITFLMYQSASDGGTYLVFYGAIILGFFQALAGLFQYLGASRSVDALRTSMSNFVLKQIDESDAKRWENAAHQLS